MYTIYKDFKYSITTGEKDIILGCVRSEKDAKEFCENYKLITGMDCYYKKNFIMRNKLSRPDHIIFIATWIAMFIPTIQYQLKYGMLVNINISSTSPCIGDSDIQEYDTLYFIGNFSEDMVDMSKFFFKMKIDKNESYEDIMDRASKLARNLYDNESLKNYKFRYLIEEVKSKAHLINIQSLNPDYNKLMSSNNTNNGNTGGGNLH